MNEIWIAGYPSFYGGADTELLANIELLVKKRVQINLVPMFFYDEKIKKYLDEMGCTTHEYNSSIFKDKIVISYCNGNFLDKLSEIINKGKPLKVIWNNTMTWTFPKEIEAHKQGWIDIFAFVSDYQEDWLRPELEKYGTVNKFNNYSPYFNLNSPILDLPFMDNNSIESFNMGRISRADPTKFSSDMWKIFEKVLSPKPTKTFILGYDQEVENKTGAPPLGLDYQWWNPNKITSKEFFSKIHVLIHKTGGSRESYGRTVPEAYSCGIPVIVEDNYAYPKLVINGETGYRCESSEEMSYRASELAFNEKLRKKMSLLCREFLIDNMGNEEKCWKAWKELLEN